MPSGDEQVLSVIPNADLSTGMAGGPGRTHTLVFTSQRIIFARFTSSMAKDLGRAQPNTKRPDQPRSATDTSGLVIEKYQAMKPDDILAEHKSNFAVERSAITKVRMKYTGGLGTGTVAELLTIKTEERTYKFALSSSKQARKALLKAGLGQTT